MLSYRHTHLQLVSQYFALGHAHVVEQCLEGLVALRDSEALVLALHILTGWVLVESGHEMMPKGVTNLVFAFGEHGLPRRHHAQVCVNHPFLLPIRLDLRIPNARRHC